MTAASFEGDQNIYTAPQHCCRQWNALVTSSYGDQLQVFKLRNEPRPLFSCSLMIMFYSNSDSSQQTLQVLILAPLSCKNLSPQQECFLGVSPLLPIGTPTTELPVGQQQLALVFELCTSYTS